MAVNSGNNPKPYSIPHIANLGFDHEFQMPMSEGLGYDGKSLQRLPADSLATKITESGDYTYIAIAAPGTAEAEEKWQVKRIDQSVAGTTVITWADGDADFDNAATDLTALTFS